MLSYAQGGYDVTEQAEATLIRSGIPGKIWLRAVNWPSIPSVPMRFVCVVLHYLTLLKQYFATSASQVLQDGRASQNTPSRPCGHCDNCTRASDDLETLDVTTDVWRSLKVMMEVSRRVGRVTLSGLADLVRGLGGGTFTLVGTVQSAADRGRIDLEAVCGGKVTLNKEVGLSLASFLLLLLIIDRSSTASGQKLS